MSEDNLNRRVASAQKVLQGKPEACCDWTVTFRFWSALGIIVIKAITHVLDTFGYLVPNTMDFF